MRKSKFVGKNKKAKQSKKSGSAKFILLGIIAGIIALGAYFAITGDYSESASVDTSKASPVLGSPSAPVTIIEFGDYQCPFCQKWNLNTKPLIEQNYIDTGMVQLIYVDLPIVGADSLKAHAGSYCANEQGMYWQYHDFMYKNQGHENDGWANTANLKTLVQQLDGLDAQKFAECLDSGKYEGQVRENQNIAMKNGARSTPSFIVIGQDGEAIRITGAQPYSTFQMAIEEKLPT